MEHWIPIEGYSNYAVSNKGRIRNVTTGRYLNPSPVAGRGFLKVRLYNKDGGRSLYVHRLVAAAYLWDYQSSQEIYHEDQDVSNNSADNLRVSTRRCRPATVWV